jgi:hypothetical protein
LGQEAVVTRLVLKDELLDAQVLRAVGSAVYGGADIGECLRAARSVAGTDLDSWHDCWVNAAEAAAKLGESAQQDGHLETARLAFMRASSYFRTAGVMLMAAPLDARLKATNAQQTEMFRRAASLLPLPPEILAIPFEDTTLPGYFFRPRRRRPPARDGSPRRWL